MSHCYLQNILRMFCRSIETQTCYSVYPQTQVHRHTSSSKTVGLMRRRRESGLCSDFWMCNRNLTKCHQHKMYQAADMGPCTKMYGAQLAPIDNHLYNTFRMQTSHYFYFHGHQICYTLGKSHYLISHVLGILLVHDFHGFINHYFI